MKMKITSQPGKDEIVTKLLAYKKIWTIKNMDRWIR